jgi:hypothetical protein
MEDEDIRPDRRHQQNGVVLGAEWILYYLPIIAQLQQIGAEYAAHGGKGTAFRAGLQRCVKRWAGRVFDTQPSAPDSRLEAAAYTMLSYNDAAELDLIYTPGAYQHINVITTSGNAEHTKVFLALPDELVNSGARRAALVLGQGYVGAVGDACHQLGKRKYGMDL